MNHHIVRRITAAAALAFVAGIAVAQSTTSPGTSGTSMQPDTRTNPSGTMNNRNADGTMNNRNADGTMNNRNADGTMNNRNADGTMNNRNADGTMSGRNADGTMPAGSGTNGTRTARADRG